MFIESGTTAKAILDLISTGNVKILVVGTTKSSLRYKRSNPYIPIQYRVSENFRFHFTEAVISFCV